MNPQSNGTTLKRSVDTFEDRCFTATGSTKDEAERLSGTQNNGISLLYRKTNEVLIFIGIDCSINDSSL